MIYSVRLGFHQKANYFLYRSFCCFHGEELWTFMSSTLSSHVNSC
uniref:Uncharacterized protein n=1 Tax=Rhizophora mucronata TaxID=61149 RepID=A0A2P2QTF6_RHIMU